MELSQALEDCPAIAILRASSADRFGEVTDVLVDAGLRAVEYTLTTPGVLAALSAYAKRAPDVALGAGTVTTADEARRAVEAGATYLITPAVFPEVLEEGARLGVPVLPGALTPTEIVTAWRAGAALVKLFPASLGGVSYLKAVRAPLPDIPLVPTGGVDPANAGEWLAAGAAAVAVGSPLVGDACSPSGDLGALAARAKVLVGSVRRG
ncbi:bifunctional 4-hydroxy-2-oxoglutarate aldolase/2-dehydro-3-deoxy-phosphogluconate aldolase [Tenggerimyces flavus]|uniref:Bifunctional 4-hydroxy-2-oxoglutarate aldolase/2-dehydro-3-deoxy-phosphogluconate aldolase n=1 Tax=Tenggerimyces flavus TaxID=1708749 RepID=A0ABV7Y7H4_9ACTN|nr:bifunctional 4-hydroxy-2-oxoglutarate aldolase/2-dehydro-3-deoxy-phosphogluconate aldolase [Tenggerimyces flavus]MBM7785167.1 2-dehydro-3-deoxyphosphogluconate aldolase/(4S)-4-hydroxy-2-oxoglutarate aldolase [Tenggerimyces flavus]